METTNAITIETLVNAPISKVWECWTEPAHIVQWAFASDDWHSPGAENDLRVGGRFNTIMASKDGVMSFDFGGVYTHVEQHALIGYKLDDDRKVKIVFSTEGETTKVIETFDPENTHPIEMQRMGWQAILDNFKKHTEASA